MKTHMTVKMTKLEGIPKDATAVHNDGSMHFILSGYTIVGWLNADVECCAPISMLRYMRNGEVCLGSFSTSAVKVIMWDSPDRCTVHTESGSVWQVETNLNLTDNSIEGVLQHRGA
jgi:hypothetical protein